MSKITAEILAKVAPGTEKAKRDRFLPYFNEALPRYGITTELRVAAFLTTVCFESDYFRATEEYASGKDYDITVNRKKAIGLGNLEPGDGVKYKGRTLIQTTGKKQYQKVTDKFGLKNGVDFVENPKKLAELKWAVEGACSYWEDSRLNGYADKGKFFAIQGLVNRGSPDKTAKDYKKREGIYLNVLHILPDDFKLDSAASPIDQNEQAGRSEPSSETTQNAADNSKPVLRFGSRGPEVLELQKTLDLSATGIFDVFTKEGVRQFQSDNGLPVDGIVGKETRAALEAQKAPDAPADDQAGNGQNVVAGAGEAGTSEPPPPENPVKVEPEVHIEKIEADTEPPTEVPGIPASYIGAGTFITTAVSWLAGATPYIIAGIAVVGIAFFAGRFWFANKEKERQFKASEAEKIRAHEMQLAIVKTASEKDLTTVRIV